MPLMLGGVAWADGTTAGISISNTATVGYKINGVQQPDVTSNAASFVVDMLVNLTVAESGGSATTVLPGATAQVTKFTVTNSSNAVLDFRLVPSQDATGATTAFGGTDGADATNVHAYVDVNGNGVYDPATDTATWIDQLAADATVAVFIVADIPGTVTNNQVIGVTLTAIAASGTTPGAQGSDLVATSGADTPSVVDIVFGDAAGRSDAARDGRHSSGDEYRVSSAAMVITKTARVMSDPKNGTNNPKPVPGAVIEYCIIMQNNGSQPASELLVTDPVPQHTTFVSGSIKSAGTVTSGVCNNDGNIEDDDASDAGETDGATGSFVNGVVSVLLNAVNAGQTLTALFRSTID